MSPAARLDADSILGAVFDILDREGIAALSMRTLAARLDVKAASLYYHVPNKAALLQMVADRIATQIMATITPGRAWRELLDGIAHDLRDILRAHPGAAAVAAVQNASPHVFEEAVPLLLFSMQSGLRLTDDVALHLVQSLYVLVTGLALAEFGNAPEPPYAPAAYYDAWFDIAVSTFLDGVQARYGTGDHD